MQPDASDPLHAMHFSDMVIMQLESIPEFNVMAHFCPKSKFRPSKALSDYSAIFEKHHEYKRKYTCHLRFQCPNRHTWKTSLGVVDIFYAYDLQQRKETNKKVDKNRVILRFLDDLVELVNVYVKMVPLRGKNLEEMIRNVSENYDVHVEFNYRIYQQRCLRCQKYGKVCHSDLYSQKALEDVASFFSVFIERELGGRRRISSKPKYQMVNPNHEVQHCEACALGQCPYDKELSRPRSSKQGYLDQSTKAYVTPKEPEQLKRWELEEMTIQRYKNKLEEMDALLKHQGWHVDSEGDILECLQRAGFPRRYIRLLQWETGGFLTALFCRLNGKPLQAQNPQEGSWSNRQNWYKPIRHKRDREEDDTSKRLSRVSQDEFILQPHTASQFLQMFGDYEEQQKKVIDGLDYWKALRSDQLYREGGRTRNYDDRGEYKTWNRPKPRLRPHDY